MLKNKIELLLFCPSPRDLEEFWEEFNKIKNYDKFIIRYMKPETTVYEIARKEFLKKEKYTHLVICPDDLLIKQQHVDQLYSDLCFLEMEKEGQSQNVCIGGYCNVNTTNLADKANVTFDRVSHKREGRIYNFPTLQQLRDMRQSLPLSASPYPFTEVKFSGFPLFAIPRKIMERIEFRDDVEDGLGCCLDVMFSYDCYMNNYTMLCDLSLELYHMKISDVRFRNYMVGVLEPNVYFEYKLE